MYRDFFSGKQRNSLCDTLRDRSGCYIGQYFFNLIFYRCHKCGKRFDSPVIVPSVVSILSPTRTAHANKLNFPISFYFL